MRVEKVLSDLILTYTAHLFIGTNALKVLTHLQHKKFNSGNLIIMADFSGFITFSHETSMSLKVNSVHLSIARDGN